MNDSFNCLYLVYCISGQNSTYGTFVNGERVNEARTLKVCFIYYSHFSDLMYVLLLFSVFYYNLVCYC